jgi:hypothetical protein
MHPARKAGQPNAKQACTTRCLTTIWLSRCDIMLTAVFSLLLCTALLLADTAAAFTLPWLCLACELAVVPCQLFGSALCNPMCCVVHHNAGFNTLTPPQGRNTVL